MFFSLLGCAKMQKYCIQIKYGSRLKSLECCYYFYAKFYWRILVVLEI